MHKENSIYFYWTGNGLLCHVLSNDEWRNFGMTRNENFPKNMEWKGLLRRSWGRDNSELLLKREAKQTLFIKSSLPGYRPLTFTKSLFWHSQNFQFFISFLSSLRNSREFMIGNSDFDGFFYVAGYYCGFPNGYVSGFSKWAARDTEISRLGFSCIFIKKYVNAFCHWLIGNGTEW
jgi:hypothetical protein